MGTAAELAGELEGMTFLTAAGKDAEDVYKRQEEKIFRQEGWHYELESEESPLIYNGVVYNCLLYTSRCV